MRALNLYTLTREVDNDVFLMYEKLLSDREETLQKKDKEELEMLRVVVDLFSDIRDLDNWFYSFTIPQISKEFDLLKIEKDGGIVNIELKSQEVPIERVIKQLLQNRCHLSHISTDIHCFTVMKIGEDSIKIYSLDGKMLREASEKQVVEAVRSIQDPINNHIENLFHPKDYLISPLNTPEKFLEKKYFLNEQQEIIKKKVINGISNGEGLWGINGGAGCGKTLLLYDIARELSTTYRVGVIHCGTICYGHFFLNQSLQNVDIIEAKNISDEWISEIDVICVDEAQRLYRDSLNLIIEAYNSAEIRSSIFSYDPQQVLSVSELNRNNVLYLSQIDGFREEHLSERIRCNKEIYSFIRTMMRLSDGPKKVINYSDIDIVYANDLEESDTILECYIRNDYDFITLTPSRYYPNTSVDHYANRAANSHHVIGQEFDKVVIILDGNFWYDENGDLNASCHPNPDYLFPKLFYQNISRAREKLCIIVVDNKNVFATLLKIKANAINYEV